MDLFTHWFDKILPLDKLRVQCPFVDEFKAEYVKCFHNVYKVQEFDWRRYLNDHPNVKKKGSMDELTTYHMWIMGQSKNGFVIGTDTVYEGFMWNDYLKLNPDLGKHGIRGEMQAYQHWINHGRKEKRVVKFEMGLISETVRDAFINKLMHAGVTETVDVKEFDWKKYLEKYPDLVKAGYRDEKRAYEHWVISGIYENRTAYILDKNEYYDTPFLWRYYLEQNPDLKHLNTELQCYNHWVDYGRNEKRGCWKKQYNINKNYVIFKDKKLNDLFLEKVSLYIQHKVYNTEKNISEIDAKLNCLLEMDKDKYDFTTDILNSKTLSNVNKNIQFFSDFIKHYKNIIFICGDYPGYGGAATNCNNLSSFYSNTHNISSIYLTTEPIINYTLNPNQYTVSTIPALQKLLSNFPFKPDLIILKNTINLDLQIMFSCPIIFLIPGIYKNSLNQNYKTLNTHEKQNDHINKAVLLQIRKSHFSFCNSAHIQSILYKWYNIKTYLFYSTFIPFYNQNIIEDPDFDKRKYDYGLIISDFNRPIKNANQSVQYLKNKKNVILIGKESHKYSKYGFECVDLQNYLEMPNYFKQIKYIIQDSHCESSSNVVIESMFYGCKKDIVIVPFEFDHTYTIEPNIRYIIGNVTSLYDNIDSLFKVDQINGYIIDNYDLKELGILVYSLKPTTINTIDLQCDNIYNVSIGLNEIQYSDSYKIALYYYYGKLYISRVILGIEYYYSEYITNQNRRYNKKLYVLVLSYYYGEMHHANYEDCILQRLNEDIFHKKTILLVSKLINGYGGCQKTSMQLIEMLDKHYNVDIISNCLNNNNKYDFQLNKLNDEIPRCLLVKNTNATAINTQINNTDYEFILNNKLNDALKWKLKQKMMVICHNSMDPFNSQILNYQEKISKLFVINQFHKNLLISYGFKQPIFVYNNHVVDTEVVTKCIRTEFNYKVAFIGRITKDKNVQELIEGIQEYNNVHRRQKITLFVVGGGSKMHCDDNYIQFLGQLTFSEIEELYKTVDYVISASVTEGKPFAIIEAQSRGIPCIHSNINAISEIIFHNKNGFVFDYASDYNKIRFDLDFKGLSTIFNTNNKFNIKNVLEQAYSITIDMWNLMSSQCALYTNFKFQKKYCEQTNLFNFENKKTSNNIQMKLFVNFKPDKNQAYGGGNISVFYLIQNICDAYSDFEITYELEPNIQIYLVIDPFKGTKFKKYGLSDIISFKEANGGKVVIRVNDCDKTREIINKERSREYQIIQNYNNIDFLIFNSNFIKQYYVEQIAQSEITTIVPSCVIINGCDQTIFENRTKLIEKTVKIVTHHWSNNMHKGYQLYYDLWKYSKTHSVDFEFTFIGKNVPAMFSSVPIVGPLVTNELSTELNNHHIYITDSIYDSCPNHVIEAISCGLPILCSNKEGGARELCTMTDYKIGELYDSFDDLLIKINKIKNDYEYYRNNIQKVCYLYNNHLCATRYYTTFLQLNSSNSMVIKPLYPNMVLHIHSEINHGYLILNDTENFKLVKGNNIFTLNTSKYHNIKLIDLQGSYSLHEFQKYQLNNDKINVLLCSDSNYFVGLFATLNSVIENTHYIDSTHFNFMIPIETKNRFSNMLLEFENKIRICLDKSIFYIDVHILDPIFFESKCYNGGGHLLNIGNLSRLLIGEFMEYKKLIYLDSDSIVQYDIIEKIKKSTLDYDIYADCANKVNMNNQKQLVIKMSSILKNYNWENIIGCKINMDDYVFMGAPFITNCTKWKNVYPLSIQIIKLHNNTANGIYKLFTMSLQNIIFYNKTGNIRNILNVLQDLGSDRKKWDKEDIYNKDVLDWSGVYKPWYTNGLYRGLWLYYDIMNLSASYGEINKNKTQIETLHRN